MYSPVWQRDLLGLSPSPPPFVWNHVHVMFSTSMCVQVLFQVALMILKQNGHRLMESADEIDAMTVLNEFFSRVGHKPPHNAPVDAGTEKGLVCHSVCGILHWIEMCLHTHVDWVYYWCLCVTNKRCTCTMTDDLPSIWCQTCLETSLPPTQATILIWIILQQ